jgi:hypothetical protein
MQLKPSRLSVTILLTTLAAVLGALSGILGTLAVDTIPTAFIPYLRLAWPAFGAVVLLGIGVSVWQARHDALATSPISLPVSRQPVSNSGTELLGPLTIKPECAWVITWQGGEKISNIELNYDDQANASRYASTMPDDLRLVIDDWCRENQEKCSELIEQPECVQLRMRKAKRLQFVGKRAIPELKFCVWLEPTRYQYYVALQQRLGKLELRNLREKYFNNALTGLESGEPLELPSDFALHVAVVSQDRHLLLRQRTRFTAHYPLAWEAGVGEFMHGPGPLDTSDPEVRSDPGRSLFSHFRKNRIPDLYLFLKNAIAEELGYRGAKQGDFHLYGFAVEYETLAPKLLAIYNSDCSIDTLIRSAKGKNVKDPARNLSSVELTPRAIAAAYSNPNYLSWEPKSKLLMLLALKQDLEEKGMNNQCLEVEKLIDRFKPGDQPVDPWEFHA